MDKLLLQFKAIVECRNMTKASEKLYIDRSTLSKNMDSLEKKLNILLLKRTNKGVDVTKEGLILYESICQMNLKYQDTLNEIHALTKNNNILTIASDLAINYHILLDTIWKVQEDHPQIIINLEQGSSVHMADRILNNDIDIFIGTLSKKTYNLSNLIINSMDKINYDLFINNDNLLITEKNINKALLNDSHMFNWYSMNNFDVMTEFLSTHKLRPQMKLTSPHMSSILDIAKMDHKACVLLPSDLMDQAINNNLGIYKPFNLSLELNTGVVYKDINQKQSLKIFLNRLSSYEDMDFI